MKKTIIFALMLAFMLPLAAQHHEGKPREKKHRDVTELVGDLSGVQKKKIDAVSRESKERVDALRRQQKAVRDSIGMIMEREGDQREVLFPLFDREAALQASISREMYSTKVRIDALLTAEQRARLRSTLGAQRKRK